MARIDGGASGLPGGARDSGVCVSPAQADGCPELTDAELDWLGKTRAQRIAALTDLLAHANEDHMSPADRQECLEALHRMGTSFSGQRRAKQVTAGTRGLYFGRRTFGHDSAR